MWVLRVVERTRNWIQNRWDSAATWQQIVAIPLLLAFIAISLAVLVPIAPFIDSGSSQAT